MSSHGLPPHLDPRGRHRGGAIARVATLKPLGRILGSILSIVLLVLAGYTWYQFRELDKGLTRLSGISTRGDQGKAQGPDIDGEDQNILVVGNDDRSNMTDAEVRELRVGKDGGSLATDTMMIVHVPADGSKATLISLPRDTQVRIPGYGMGKLNSAYATAYSNARGNGKSLDDARTAGANLLLSTIRNLTGLSFDHYVQVDLLGFYRIAKAIGRIPVNMCNAVDDRIKTNIANGEGVVGSGLKLPKGRSEITGVQALEFVRQRHGLDGGDFDRVKRQQYFLTAAFRQIASVGVVTKLQELGDALKRSVYFDGNLELIPLAKQMENLTADNIVGRTIPVNINTGYQNPTQVRKFVDNLINPSTSTTTPKSSSPKQGGTTPKKSTTSKAPIDARCIN